MGIRPGCAQLRSPLAVSLGVVLAVTHGRGWESSQLSLSVPHPNLPMKPWASLLHPRDSP